MMNKYKVYIVAGPDEIYLGTVGDITGATVAPCEGGIGISVASVISDLIAAIAYDEGPHIFSIELREPGES